MLLIGLDGDILTGSLFVKVSEQGTYGNAPLSTNKMLNAFGHTQLNIHNTSTKPLIGAAPHHKNACNLGYKIL